MKYEKIEICEIDNYTQTETAKTTTADELLKQILDGVLWFDQEAIIRKTKELNDPNEYIQIDVFEPTKFLAKRYLINAKEAIKWMKWMNSKK